MTSTQKTQTKLYTAQFNSLKTFKKKMHHENTCGYNTFNDSFSH